MSLFKDKFLRIGRKIAVEAGDRFTSQTAKLSYAKKAFGFIPKQSSKGWTATMVRPANPLKSIGGLHASKLGMSAMPKYPHQETIRGVVSPNVSMQTYHVNRPHTGARVTTVHTMEETGMTGRHVTILQAPHHDKLNPSEYKQIGRQIINLNKPGISHLRLAGHVRKGKLGNAPKLGAYRPSKPQIDTLKIGKRFGNL